MGLQNTLQGAKVPHRGTGRSSPGNKVFLTGERKGTLAEHYTPSYSLPNGKARSVSLLKQNGQPVTRR
ncbi:MAG: hypothetical protein LUE99_16935 [Bacteroides sp.]|nr:hypothetical protein [Bacteroides sp.]